jgi:hypothetical protein
MASGTVADIKVGDNVIVTGDDTTGTGVTANSVTDNGSVSGRTGFGGRGFAGNRFAAGGTTGNTNGTANSAPQGPRPQQGGFTAGKVASVDGSTFTVTAFDGSTVTVSTTAQTTVDVTKTASLSEIKVGDTISATGADSNGVVTATTVRIGAVPFGGFGRGRQGVPPTGGTAVTGS